MIPTIEDSAWPVVRIIYGQTIELSEIEHQEARLQDVFQRRGPYATLSDISDLSILKTTALHRSAIAAAADRLAARDAFLAEAVVIRDALSRGLYLGYNWLRRGKQYPSEIFATEADALSWVRAQVERASAEPTL